MQNQVVTELETGVARVLKRLSVYGRPVVVGVSGGPDSMALASIFHRLRLPFQVCTVDHQLRPESAAECALVATWCADRGVACEIRRVSLEPGGGLEAKARTARYQALNSLRTSLGYEFLATAHTASDQAETLLMRLIRGTSLSGAAGIHELRADGVLRPLLFATRAEVLKYLKELEIPHVTDPMNTDHDFLRVRIRETVLPALTAAAGFEVAPAFSRFANQAAGDESYLSSRAFDEIGHVVVGEELGPPALSRSGVLSLPLPIARRVLAHFLTASWVPVDAALVDDCLRAAREGTNATLPGDQLLQCGAEELRIVAAPARTK